MGPLYHREALEHLLHLIAGQQMTVGSYLKGMKKDREGVERGMKESDEREEGKKGEGMRTGERGRRGKKKGRERETEVSRINHLHHQASIMTTGLL